MSRAIVEMTSRREWLSEKAVVRAQLRTSIAMFTGTHQRLHDIRARQKCTREGL